MTKNVIPEIPILALNNRKMVLKAGKDYDAISNPNGAISGICANGAVLGVRPGEFQFISAPDWVLKLWEGKDYD